MYTKAKSEVNPYVVVYVRKNRSEENRLGYTVSTKLGHAVVRNRIRRQLREIVRTNAERCAKGRDIVIVARSRCVNGDYHRMEEAVMDAFGKLGLLEEAE